MTDILRALIHPGESPPLHLTLVPKAQETEHCGWREAHPVVARRNLAEYSISEYAGHDLQSPAVVCPQRSFELKARTSMSATPRRGMPSLSRN